MSDQTSRTDRPPTAPAAETIRRAEELMLNLPTQGWIIRDLLALVFAAEPDDDAGLAEERRQFNEAILKLVAERDALKVALEACREQIVAILQAVDLPAECVHGEEPDYCDACAHIQEQALAVAIQGAREVLASSALGASR